MWLKNKFHFTLPKDTLRMFHNFDVVYTAGLDNLYVCVLCYCELYF